MAEADVWASADAFAQHVLSHFESRQQASAFIAEVAQILSTEDGVANGAAAAAGGGEEKPTAAASAEPQQQQQQQQPSKRKRIEQSPGLEDDGGADEHHEQDGAAKGRARTDDSLAIDNEETAVALLVPNGAVRRLIGKSGAVAKEIETKTGAKLEFEKEADMLPTALGRGVMLLGTVQQCSAAQKNISQRLVADETHSLWTDAVRKVAKGGGTHRAFATPNMPFSGIGGAQSAPMSGGGGGGGGGGQAVVRTTVPNDAVAKLIGKGGERVRELQVKTGTKIDFDHSSNGPMRGLTIKGPSRAIEAACAEMFAFIGIPPAPFTAVSGNIGGGGSGGGSGGGMGGGSGLGIGNPGMGLQGNDSLFSPSNVVDPYKPQPQPSGFGGPGNQPQFGNQFNPYGGASNQGGPASGYGGGGGGAPLSSNSGGFGGMGGPGFGGPQHTGNLGGFSQGGGPAAMPVASTGGATTATMQVPNESVGRLIGKGGDQVRELEMQSGAKIEFDQNSSGPYRIVTITGPPHSVQYCDGLIRHKLSNWGFPSF